MNPDLDALRLLAGRQRWSLKFGPIEAATSMERININHSMNGVPDAQISLDLELVATPIDYFSMLKVARTDVEQRSSRFLGTVVKSQAAGNKVTINAMSAVSLAEIYLPYMSAAGISAPELIYVIARAAGFREDQLSIQGIESLPRETFEVLVPIDGIDLEYPVTFGNVRFLPADAIPDIFGALNVDDDLRERFNSPSYALSLVTTTRCLDAECQALANIDLALSWLTVKLRYGFSILPNGQPIDFKREESLANPGRRDFVFLRGIRTSRQWLRDPRAAQRKESISLKPDQDRFCPQLPPLSLQERLAILALSRAAQEVDPLAGVLAIFESIEFYVAESKVSDLFSKHDRRAIRKNLPEALTKNQRKRLEQLIGDLNHAPLRARLMQALDDDKVPVDPAEMNLLWQLRQIRNDVVHGRSSNLPSAEDVESAVSLVSRMLVYRIARRSL